MLKSKIKQWLQLLTFLAIGIGLFYWLYKDVNWRELKAIVSNQINFYWIAFSFLMGIISHWARAERWKMIINATGGNVNTKNALMAVFTGYLANLALPRLGEVTRCGVLSKYSNLSFVKLVGTVVAERLIDVILMIVLIIVALTLEFSTLKPFISANISMTGVLVLFTSVWWWLFVITLPLVAWYVIKKGAQLTLFRKMKELWAKFAEGFASVRKVKSKGTLTLLSILIWVMYFLMLYVCFFAMNETSNLTVSAGLVLLATGSIGMLAPVQGGIGTWHGMVIATLALYGITHEPAYAFALVVHGSQHLLVILGGLLSFVLLPIVNRQKIQQ